MKKGILHRGGYSKARMYEFGRYSVSIELSYSYHYDLRLFIPTYRKP